ncbi:MAG TPA: preprotein translocase subunit YajC [Acidimicrobiales bacterium]
MEPLIVLAVTFVLLWLLFILPQQRRVRAHQALVDAVQPGDQVVLSAGIFGRIVDLGPEEMTLEVAPGVVVRVARQAVLRRVEDVTGVEDAAGARDMAGIVDLTGGDDAPGAAADAGAVEPDAGTGEPTDGTPSGDTAPGGTATGDTEPNPES